MEWNGILEPGHFALVFLLTMQTGKKPVKVSLRLASSICDRTLAGLLKTLH